MTLTTDGALAAETPAKADVRSWKAPIALAVFTVLYALLILAVPRVGVTTFRISTQSDALQLPEIVVPVGITTWVVFGLLVLLTVFAAVLVRGFRKTPALADRGVHRHRDRRLPDVGGRRRDDSRSQACSPAPWPSRFR